jgi:tRNA uridine 5-carboxymethylaminomethyl modification enzyme
MFTSRAEFRLLLRADNADARLTPLGRQWGLVDDARWNHHQHKAAALDALRQYLAAHSHAGRRLLDWARQPQVDADWILAQLNGDPLPPRARDRAVIDALLADLLYAGYLDRQQRDIDRLTQQEDRPLPPDCDYDRITGLRNEAKHVLSRFRPATFGQAARLAGITPADMMVLTVTLTR